MHASRLHRAAAPLSLLLLLPLLAASLLPLRAEEDASLGVAGVRISGKGVVEAAGLRLALRHFGPGWAYLGHDALVPEGAPQAGDGTWEARGTLTAKGGAQASLSETLTKTGPNGVALAYRLDSENGFPTELACIGIEIPAKVGAGKTVAFSGDEVVLPETPAEKGKGQLLPPRRTDRLVLPTVNGTLEIAGSGLLASVVDERAFGGAGYSVRILFSPSAGELHRADLAFKIRRFDLPRPFVATEGAEWVPYRHQLGIEPGGVFDRSAFIDAPAGRQGRVIAAPDGRLVFEGTGQRARFWGVNLCFKANFPSHAQADELAQRLARSGYNAVRLHHYDRDLVKPGGRSYEFDPEQLDKLEYLVGALKKQGLYITTDLYTFRQFQPEEIPDLGRPFRTEFKALVPISEAAFASWGQFARNLLTHRNPYTGLTWAEDPVLVSVCALNEDSLFGGFAKNPPEVVALYREAFARSEEGKALGKDADGKARAAAFNRFLFGTKIASDARMFAFLRGLGVKALLTSDNHKASEAQVEVRDRFDLVDQHGYWGHPTFPGKRWEVPVAVDPKSALEAGAALPRGLMSSRIFGKPFTVTEFNYVWPNANRSEGGLLMGAYAALQDWDAVFTFDYGDDLETLFSPSSAHIPGRMFSIANDPVGLLADRAAAFLFLHGDVAPARTAVAYLVGKEGLFSGAEGEFSALPEAFSWIGLRVRIGSVPFETLARPGFAGSVGLKAAVGRADVLAEAKPPIQSYPLASGGDRVEATLASAGLFPAREGTNRVAEGGQIASDPAALTAKAVTDMAEYFVLGPDRKAKGDRVAVGNGKTFGSVYVASADGKPLAQSGRLMVLHLTDSLTAGTRFADGTRSLLEAFGDGGHLVRDGTAEIAVSVDPGSEWEAWALDATGRRTRPVPLRRQGNAVAFDARVAAPEGAVLAYELARKS
ncbi:MAG TPA: hypothetical protein VIM58_05255 [Candidatus Methylacidiphilales bacterium]